MTDASWSLVWGMLLAAAGEEGYAFAIDPAGHIRECALGVNGAAAKLALTGPSGVVPTPLLGIRKRIGAFTLIVCASNAPYVVGAIVPAREASYATEWLDEAEKLIGRMSVQA